VDVRPRRVGGGFVACAAGLQLSVRGDPRVRCAGFLHLVRGVAARAGGRVGVRIVRRIRLLEMAGHALRVHALLCRASLHLKLVERGRVVHAVTAGAVGRHEAVVLLDTGVDRRLPVGVRVRGVARRGGARDRLGRVRVREAGEARVALRAGHVAVRRTAKRSRRHMQAPCIHGRRHLTAEEFGLRVAGETGLVARGLSQGRRRRSRECARQHQHPQQGCG